MYAHRLAYRLTRGEIGNLHVCHTCDTPRCCNPSHHFLGSAADNMADMAMKGRARRVGNGQGDESPNRKVSSDDVRQIRDLAGRGTSQYELARQFGLKQPTISCIVRRSTWKHIA